LVDTLKAIRASALLCGGALFTVTPLTDTELWVITHLGAGDTNPSFCCQWMSFTLLRGPRCGSVVLGRFPLIRE
jgi:hypothetical protein